MKNLDIKMYGKTMGRISFDGNEITIQSEKLTDKQIIDFCQAVIETLRTTKIDGIMIKRETGWEPFTDI